MSLAIEAEGLQRSFGETRALGGVDLSVPAGQVLGVLGPNGAGKTTLVRILTTLLKPDEGRGRVGGYCIHDQAHQVRQCIGLTGQYASVDEKLTGFENLLLLSRLLGHKRHVARQRARELLADFGLEEAAGRPVQGYSGGMRRRLDLAASLVDHPRILFLDEPTTGLDPRARRELWSLVRRLVGDGVTVLLTTQYLEEADQLADDIVVIDHGRVIARGAPDELKSRVGSQKLTVQVEQMRDIPRAATVVESVCCQKPELAGRRLTVPVRDSSVLAPLTTELESAGVRLRELSLRGASLDDVFLSLTGRPAEATRNSVQQPPMSDQEEITDE